MSPSSPSSRSLRVAPLLALAAVAACTTSTGPSRAEVAGVYRLELMGGRAVPDTTLPAAGYAMLDGAIVLHSDGNAERSLTYRDGTGRLMPVVTSGSFVVHGAAVEFRLKESNDYTWRVRGDLVGAVLTLRYPNPGDGTIVERYRREELTVD